MVFELALRLGYTEPDEMLEQMTSDTFTKWKALFMIHAEEAAAIAKGTQS